MRMEYKHMWKVEVDRLVKDEIKSELYFNNRTTLNNNIIWQQMTCENFCSFLHERALYFKGLSFFDAKDERKLQFYGECYKKADTDKTKRKIIERLYKDFERITYISCWYDLDWLTKLVFNAYAGDYGIAIGVNKERLLKTIDAASEDYVKPKEEIFYGNVAYISDEHKDVVDSDEVIAPLFLKSKLFSADNEFRLVFVRDSLWQSSLNGMSLPDDMPEEDWKGTWIGIGKVSQFVEYIAVKDCIKTFEAICEKYRLNIKKSKYKMDGFSIYEVERC